MSSSSVHISQTSAYYNDTTMSDTDRETARIREAYYAAYDVMTGVRIAATLGGFFGLMVILVVYKSKSKTEKALEDPHVQAVALAEAEEEERQIAAALEQTVYEQLNPAAASAMFAAAHASFSSGSGSGRRIRHSLDTCHSGSDRVAPGWIRQTKRFSSVGGYSSLLEPPIRIHKTGVGGGMLCSSSIIDEDSPPVTIAEDGVELERSCYEDVSTYFNGRNLYVPRRASNITCSSTGSAYLERRGSNILQFTPVPVIKSPIPHNRLSHGNRRRQSSPMALGVPQRFQPYRLCAQSTICSDDGASAGDGNAIDIRVIQPTPGGSPAGSERHLGEDGRVIVEGQGIETGQHRRLAPLASISSCNSSTFDPTITDAAPSPPQRHQARTARLVSNTSSTNDYYYYPDMDLLATEDTTDTDTVFRDMDCLCRDDDDIVAGEDADADDDNTDDEVDTFSTDSGDLAAGCSCQHQQQLQSLHMDKPTNCYRRRLISFSLSLLGDTPTNSSRLLPSPLPPQPSSSQHRYYQPPSRRHSTMTQTTPSVTTSGRDFLAEFTSSCTRMIDSTSSSSTCHHCHQELVEVEMCSPVHERTALMPKSRSKRDSAVGYEQCPSCSSPLLMDEERQWTQETLF